MKVVARIVLAVVSVSLLSSAPALADPPPSNKNIEPFTFDCMRGSESRHFVAIGIGQSAHARRSDPRDRRGGQVRADHRPRGRGLRRPRPLKQRHGLDLHRPGGS